MKTIKIFAKWLAAVFIAVVFCLPMTACGVDLNSAKSNMTLNFKENFKIMQLADIQVSNIDECEKAFIKVGSLVKSEKPDLIVLTGDNVSCPYSTFLVEVFINQMEKLNTPWTAAFGNHDGEGCLTNAQIATMFEKAPHCIFKNEVDDVYGDCNFTISLKSNNGVKFGIVILDSNSYRLPNGETTRFGSGAEYDYIHTDQIAWYERAINSFTENNNGQVVPTLSFFHIPLPEFKDAKALWETDPSVGSGIFREAICSPNYNSGLFAKMKALGSTKAVFCGHEHINNCNIVYEGINLVYGLKSSAYSYCEDDMQGATIITLASDGGIKISTSNFN